MTNCRHSTGDSSLFTPKIRMSSGPLCWRKPTPSMEHMLCFSSTIGFISVNINIHCSQSVWLLHRHDFRHPRRSFDGLHWWCSHACRAVRPTFRSVEADVQSWTIQVTDGNWNTSRGKNTFNIVFSLRYRNTLEEDAQSHLHLIAFPSV